MHRPRITTDPTRLLERWAGILSLMKTFSPLILAGENMIPQLLPILEGQGMFPDAVLSAGPEERTVCGIAGIRREALRDLPPSAGICVCRLGGVELAHELASYTDLPVLDAFLPLGSRMFAAHFDPRIIAGNMDRIRSVRALLSDDASRDVFDRTLAFRLSYDLGLMPAHGGPQYHHPPAAPRAGDVIVDAGAYDGDSAASFAAATDNRVRIYAFEPDAKNLAALRRTLRGARLDDIVETIPMALWREEGYVPFGGSGPGAHIGETDADQVRATTIDAFCSARGIRPTLVKTDVEGADIDALRGAARTVSSCRPRLALSVYHRPEDLWEIPLLAARLRPGSRFSLVRHPSPEALAELVCYVYDPPAGP